MRVVVSRCHNEVRSALPASSSRAAIQHVPANISNMAAMATRIVVLVVVSLHLHGGFAFEHPNVVEHCLGPSTDVGPEPMSRCRLGVVPHIQAVTLDLRLGHLVVRLLVRNQDQAVGAPSKVRTVARRCRTFVRITRLL